MNKHAKKIKNKIETKEQFFGNLLKHYDKEWVSSDISHFMEVRGLIFIKNKHAKILKQVEYESVRRVKICFG